MFERNTIGRVVFLASPEQTRLAGIYRNDQAQKEKRLGSLALSALSYIADWRYLSHS
jgi:hypothetical protein